LLRRGTDHRGSPTRGWVVRLAALAMVVAVGRAAIWYAHSHDFHAQATYVQSRVPAVTQEHGYVSSAACQSCHPGHFASWHATYHRTMTQPAFGEAVVGDFNEHRVSYDGIDYLLFRRGEGYWARLTPQSAGAGAAQEVQLVMTTGSHHYQVYWVNEGPKRSLIEFPLAWLIADQRWIPREAALVMPPHLKQQAVLWNGICIRCHSTHSQPRMDAGSQLADTTVAELGISCEACHGPAEEHIRANQNPSRRYAQHLGDQGDPTIINPARLSAERSSQVCGQCHAIASFGRQDWWRGHWNAFQPGADLHTTRNVIQPTQEETLADLREALKANPDYLIGHYWRDGMVRVSGREYNGLIESPCYQGGKFSCLSCHSMHASDPNDQLSAGMLSDQACLQCHEDFRDRVAEHSHHAADSAGSRCYNCHMPHTTYGLLKAIRSHQVSNPSVAASVSTGRPNACNQCHLNQGLGWTQEHMAAWYGTAKVELNEDDEQLSSIATLLLRGDAGQRALAAWSMGWEEAHTASGDKWQPPFLAQLLDDPYPAVRYIAVRSLRRLPGYETLEFDFVGPQHERQEAQRRALAVWEQSANQRLDQTGPAILIDAAGRLDRATFERLLKLRDDRDIDLKE
jgi:predicted CXXCH cytochrome family protein